jgi:hypothetical protein
MVFMFTLLIYIFWVSEANGFQRHYEQALYSSEYLRSLPFLVVSMLFNL